jgi:hypothetical protein
MPASFSHPVTGPFSFVAKMGRKPFPSLVIIFKQLIGAPVREAVWLTKSIFIG